MNRDFTYSVGCGCKVTFFADSQYHTSRMTYGETCTVHPPNTQAGLFSREVLLSDAKESLKEYLSMKFTKSELEHFQKEFNETQPVPVSESEIKKIVDAMVSLEPCDKAYNCTCIDRTTCRMMIESRDRCIQNQARIISDLKRQLDELRTERPVNQ